MATYTLIPSSWGGTSSVTNPSNAYADTTSTTYAEATMYSGGTQTPACLGGFDFSTIPQGSTITGLTVKVKAARSGTSTCSVRLVQSAEVLASSLSDSQSLTTTETVYTLDLTSSVATILEYKDTLCLRFTGSGMKANVYGAEIIVDVTLPSRNKIVYGNETLIDLTGDTATASDVAVGKTFHLASGLQATGTLSPSVATATTTSSTAREVSFTVSKEPSWFMMIFASNTSTERSYRVYHMRYDGTTTKTYYGNGSTAGSLTTSDSFGSFSYSSGTLTITVKTAPYFGSAGWALYYL